jgi:D-glycero-alpha-D-manno-heptose-7-phosphate kinase
VHKVKHPILRECLKLTGLTRGVEVTSMADVVGGTGLGSSSSFTVGVLHALHAYKGEYVSSEQLAQEACTVEIGLLKEPIGKQDQYIAAYGGFQSLEFRPDDSVRVDPLIFPEKSLHELQDHLLLMYTGVTRRASPLLRRFRAGFSDKSAALSHIRALAEQTKSALQSGRVQEIGELLHEGWLAKKSVASGVSSGSIDRAYDAARKSGALGGKVLGAGGGGFLLLFVTPKKRAAVRAALKSWREIPFRFEKEGSKIVYVSQ